MNGKQQKKRGEWGEQCAVEFMRHSGLDILARNYHSRYGEIDIIASDGRFLIFAEVKTRKGDRFGRPGQAVTLSKQRKLTLTAQQWLNEHPMSLQPRFDVIEVYYREGSERAEIVPILNAFEAAE